MNTEIGFSGFRNRLREIVGKKEPWVWAREAGISGSTFDRAWNGGAIPKAETLAKMAAAGGVTIDWLLLGVPPMLTTDGLGPKGAARGGGAPEPGERHPLDQDLLERILALVEDWLSSNHLAMPAAAKARFIVQAYSLCLEDAREAGSQPSAIVEKSVPRYLKLIS